jgi:hypothetical protein
MDAGRCIVERPPLPRNDQRRHVRGETIDGLGRRWKTARKEKRSFDESERRVAWLGVYTSRLVCRFGHSELVSIVR